jgi:hypothetical protein
VVQFDYEKNGRIAGLNSFVKLMVEVQTKWKEDFCGVEDHLSEAGCTGVSNDDDDYTSC